MLNADAFVPWKPCDGEDEFPHPTPVCEPINLACTSLPKLEYNLKSLKTDGLSTMQTETIRRIFQSFAVRQGFLLGDATGVGKGRTIAGVLHESKARDPNFRAIWISANNRLKHDAEEEIKQICAVEDMASNLCFYSYTSLLKNQHLQSSTDFLNSGGECLIILDECHNLRNNSVTAKRIEHVLSCNENINVLYSSATAASSSKHLQYLSKLELWGSNTPFPTYAALAAAIKTYGTPLMELVSIEMRAKGAYISRQLSFEHVIMEHRHINLTLEEQKMYNDCVSMMQRNNRIGGSNQQMFFQKIITGLKTKYAIQAAIERLDQGDSVVISLVNTGEAYAKKRKNNTYTNPTTHHRICEDVMDELGEDIENMPINPIDEIIQRFGRDNVAELTGRNTIYMKNVNGIFESCTKIPLKKEVESFQSGQKRIAVLSRAGGVGISLHDNKLGTRRSHIILELPWSAEDFVQQMGRTHRSNSITVPHYILLSTDIPSEMRFVGCIVSKLASMGALVRGDRSCSNVKWLDVPKWSTNTRRSLGLYLSTAKLYNSNCILETISRRRALAICGYTGNNVNTPDISVKTRLTSLMSQSSSIEQHNVTETENNDANNVNHTNNTLPTKTDLLNAARTLFPQDVESLFSSWTPETHCFYPVPFKDRILTFLLCYNAWETRNNLGNLPESIIHLIIEMIAQPCNISDAKISAERFEQHHIKLDNMANIQTDFILNRLLGMEINVQSAVMSYTKFLSYSHQPTQVSCFINYVQERAGSTIQCEIRDFQNASFSEGATGVRISVHYSPRNIESPSSNVIFWRHGKSSRVVWINKNKMIGSDGMKAKIEDTSEAHMHNKGYVQTTPHEWRLSLERNFVLAKRRCRKLSTRFYLATENTMSCWDTSMHKVLRIPSCIQFPKGLVGLLVFINT
tara:strand:+ start:46 stop:2790 length:2745 start_codon:yes stop_codon:yes gene_type:complete